jgi:para-nitrobenzyl esterase
MKRIYRAVFCAVLAVAACAAAVDTGASAATATTGSQRAPVVPTEGGAVRGTTVDGTHAFLGLPYAAPPTGRLRWRAPEPAARWQGVRDASRFGPSCPQQAGLFTPAGEQSEDCLYLNVYTPPRADRRDRGRPVLVWIHGGGLALGAGRDYVPTDLAADGTVVVTINYRLGALGFLAHPALASRPGGPSGNYGLMDQQAALRWVQRNIGAFGGDPHNVTIAGQSAGGLSVLAHMASRGSRGLFQKAIVQSGAFALTQQSLAEGEVFGQTIAAAVHCTERTAECLRALPAQTLVDIYPPAAIPGIVDGKVLTESVGTALAAGRFARVPVLDGMNHDEELIFVLGAKAPVIGGRNVPLTEDVTAENYQQVIASTLGVSDARAAAIAAEYPASAYPLPALAYSALVGDANFACTARQLDEWTAARGVPTFAYQFDDDAAPARYVRLPLATHGSELPYIFDLPDTPLQDPFSADSATLAGHMRAAWASFAATGNPSTRTVPWPSFNRSGDGLSLVAPQPQRDTTFATRHHCAFWAGG